MKATFFGRTIDVRTEEPTTEERIEGRKTAIHEQAEALKAKNIALAKAKNAAIDERVAVIGVQFEGAKKAAEQKEKINTPSENLDTASPITDITTKVREKATWGQALKHMFSSPANMAETVENENTGEQKPVKQVEENTQDTTPKPKSEGTRDDSAELFFDTETKDEEIKVPTKVEKTVEEKEQSQASKILPAIAKEVARLVRNRLSSKNPNHEISVHQRLVQIARGLSPESVLGFEKDINRLLPSEERKEAENNLGKAKEAAKMGKRLNVTHLNPLPNSLAPPPKNNNTLHYITESKPLTPSENPAVSSINKAIDPNSDMPSVKLAVNSASTGETKNFSGLSSAEKAKARLLADKNK